MKLTAKLREKLVRRGAADAGGGDPTDSEKPKRHNVAPSRPVHPLGTSSVSLAARRCYARERGAAALRCLSGVTDVWRLGPSELAMFDAETSADVQPSGRPETAVAARQALEPAGEWYYFVQ